jgi:lactate dehydrogenase-like 2-hydroxyacid dehydrogenase
LFDESNRAHCHTLHYLEARLTATACALADGFPAICVFVNDQLDGNVLIRLAGGGTRVIALRSAGFNHVDVVFTAHQAFFTREALRAIAGHYTAECVRVRAGWS